jgi:hypothetical protein
MATLATVSSVNKTLVDAGGQPGVRVADNRGVLRRLHDSYVVGAADEFGTSGLVRTNIIIPKNAVLVDARFICPDSGATGTFDIGWAASAELDSAGSPVVAASAAGIFSAQDTGTAAVDARMSGTVAGYNKLFAAAVEVQIDCTAVTTALKGLTMHLECWIVDLS